MNIFRKISFILFFALAGMLGSNQNTFAVQNEPSSSPGAGIWVTGGGSSDACYPSSVSLTSGFYFNMLTTAGYKYRVLLNYNRFDLEQVNFGSLIKGENVIRSFYTPSKTAPLSNSAINTAYIYSAGGNTSRPVTATGYYRVIATLQREVSAGVWADLETISSPYVHVAPNDYNSIVAPYIRVIRNNEHFASFQVNGITGWKSGLTAPPTLCSGSLIMDNIAGSFADNVEISVSKGTWSGGGFFPVSTSSYYTSIPGTKLADQDLNALFGSYIGNTYGSSTNDYLKVTFKIESNVCDAMMGDQYTFEQVFKIKNASIIGNYYLYRAIINAIGTTDNKKPLKTTLPIADIPVMAASTTTLANFKNILDTSVGWQGATSAGISEVAVDVANSNWTLLVYEVDGITGNRQNINGVLAPNIDSSTGTAATGSLKFNEDSKVFDPTITTANYHLYDTSTFGDGPYFSEYYNWAKSQGQIELAAFSAKTWCVEFSVTNSGIGCSSSKRSYFRIASNFTLIAAVAQKPSGPSETSLLETIAVFPNPTRGMVNFTFGNNSDNTVTIINNFGQVVRKAEHIKDRQYQINISDLAAGLYLYQIQSGDKVQHGKLIKK
jgi:hypothetical protein